MLERILKDSESLVLQRDRDVDICNILDGEEKKTLLDTLDCTTSLKLLLGLLQEEIEGKRMQLETLDHVEDDTARLKAVSLQAEIRGLRRFFDLLKEVVDNGLKLDRSDGTGYYPGSSQSYHSELAAASPNWQSTSNDPIIESGSGSYSTGIR